MGKMGRKNVVVNPHHNMILDLTTVHMFEGELKDEGSIIKIFDRSGTWIGNIYKNGFWDMPKLIVVSPVEDSYFADFRGFMGLD